MQLKGKRLVGIVVILLEFAVVCADFVFPSFSSPLNGGIVLVGDATFSNCSNDAINNSIANSVFTTTTLTVYSTSTSYDAVSCTTPVLRLTTSRPHQASAAWHSSPQALAGGFHTTFRFQISNGSRTCLNTYDLNDVETPLMQICGGNGVGKHLGELFDVQASTGDGLAFVIQRSLRTTGALGSSGFAIGYDGIANSIAFEFDFFSNLDIGDPSHIHFSVHSAGTGTNHASTQTALINALALNLSNAEIHDVTIVYSPSIVMDYVISGKFAATDALRNFVSKSVGMFCVFLDDSELLSPLVCFPFDLHGALSLSAGQAYIGFTASTGTSWQTHDILSWSFSS